VSARDASLSAHQLKSNSKFGENRFKNERCRLVCVAPLTRHRAGLHSMEVNMKTLTTVLLLGTVMALSPALAFTNAQPSEQRSVQSNQTLTQLPSSGLQVSDFYRQTVYDPKDNKIGDVKDLILEKDGKVSAAIIGVGGFLGAGEKDVAVPFDQKAKAWGRGYCTIRQSSRRCCGAERRFGERQKRCG